MKCLQCGKETKSPKFCSLKCSATYNNLLRGRKTPKYVCSTCGKEFQDTHYRRTRKYCSRSCIRIARRQTRLQKAHPCAFCGEPVFNKGAKKYCSNSCSQKAQWKKIEDRIVLGKFVSHRSLRLYLVRKHGARCERCSWAQLNTHSRTVPVVLNHKDGNSNNNTLNNVELLCPNCDSLTPTYKGLNKGSGRHYRKIRFKEGKSY